MDFPSKFHLENRAVSLAIGRIYIAKYKNIID